MAAASANSFLVGNNKTQIPALKPKSLLHPNKPNTLTLAGKTKPVSVRCVSSPTQLQDGSSKSIPTGSQDRVFNFAAGPATLPENVLLKAQSDLYNWRGSGMSVMEMSHRGKEFLSIIQKAESDLRQLLEIPSEYSVLFLQGGATTQFAGLPLNLCKPDETVDFVVTGSWGDKAVKEAKKYCKTNVIWSGKGDKYTKVPSFDELEQSLDAKYLHICANETIHGVEFKEYDRF